MLGSRRQSAASPAPPLTPISPSPSPVSRSASISSLHRSTSSLADITEHGTDVRNVRVVLRVRPSDPDDASVPPRFRKVLVHPVGPADVKVDVDPATLAGAAPSHGVSGNKRHPTFSFDSVLGESSTQADLYDATSKDIVDEFLKGHNVTFLAYGQTSSGKSYSMGTTGEDVDYTGSDVNPRTGLIPRTVHTIFEKAEQLKIASGPGASWECRLSFLELYNEEIIDLLSGAGVAVAIREERDGRIVWSGVREVKVNNLAEVMRYLYDGSARRKTGATGMNATSSRSHAIFSLTMVQRRRSKSATALLDHSLGEVATPSPPARQLRRPASMIGMAARSPTASINGQTPPSAFAKGAFTARPQSFRGPSPSKEEFVIITSKFNMVDLAGSERLKRTAAQGERMKEGISINSGLLALGNVISTLADPVKARGHVSYRDSKLTRMLQDSIGGNALTTMIACVSPIEYNINETINTIKYASRAKNIKNTARVNAIEAGWDDVEHLQTLVTRLRKQLAGIENGDALPSALGVSKNGNGQHVLHRLTDLQREHTELYDRYLEKCSENMRLTSELKDAKPADGDAMARFNETVEPVILEYEKVVGGLNEQLDELRAELTHISELYEEQNRQLIEAQSRQSSHDAYVNELRGRLAMLTERNTSGESYIQDLEAKLKSQEMSTSSHEDVVAELRKELVKAKETNVRLERHAAEMEERLARSDERSSALLRQMEQSERDSEQLHQAYRDLEKRMGALDDGADNKLLSGELIEKIRYITDLEKQLLEHGDVQSERDQLREALTSEQAARRELRAELDNLRDSSSSVTSGTREASVASLDQVSVSQEQRISELEIALRDTSAGYANIETELKESEQQRSALEALLAEVRLGNAEMSDVVARPSSSPSSDEDDDSESGSPSGATSESSRSSASSSSTLVSVKTRGFRDGRGCGESKRVKSRLLLQELSSARSLDSQRNFGIGLESLRISPARSRQSLPARQKQLRYTQSLEAELRFVHEVVDKRDEELRSQEAYIRRLEDSIQDHTSHLILSRPNSAEPNTVPSQAYKHGFNPKDISLPCSPVGRAEPAGSDNDESSLQGPRTHVGTLLKDMVEKESSQRAMIEQQFVQIADLQKANNKLKQELQDRGHSVIPSSPPRMNVRSAFPRTSSLSSFKSQRVSLISPTLALNRVREEHADEVQDLINNHAKEMESLKLEHEKALAELSNETLELKAEHASVLDRLRSENRQTLDRMAEEHAAALTQLQSEHDSALAEMERAAQQHLVDLSRRHQGEMEGVRREQEDLFQEIAKDLTSSEEERRQLKIKVDRAGFEVSRLRDEAAIYQRETVKELSDLRATAGRLEEVKKDLKTENEDLSRRLAELDNAVHCKNSPMPPQGPPPQTPLPPIPTALSSPMMRDNSLDGTQSWSTCRSTGSTAPTSLDEVASVAASLPQPLGLMVQKVMAERDAAAAARERLLADLEKAREAANLSKERNKAESLERELREARKTNSRLRVHLDDARNESKRIGEACREHMEELNNRRNTMASLSLETGQHRDSLMAATAQVAALKAQLDRTVEERVNKKTNNGLKCF